MQSWSTIVTTTKAKGESMEMFNPPHPGHIVKGALDAVPITITDFASHIGVSRVQLSRVLNGRAAITAELSIKLTEAFGQASPDIWFKMQNKYDFWHATHARRKKIRPLKLPRAA